MTLHDLFGILLLLYITPIISLTERDNQVTDLEDSDIDSVNFKTNSDSSKEQIDFKIQNSENTRMTSCDDTCVNVEPKSRPFRRSKKKKKIKLSQTEKDILVRIHNVYRNKVKPTAANMEWMQWDESLAEMAQGWADTCNFRNGLPAKPHYYQRVGQNLYMGSDRDVMKPVFHWYHESQNYSFYSTRCLSSNQCGNYTTMVSAVSNKIGCAMSQCPPYYYTVCNYYPPSNFPNKWPYKTGAPCSLCENADGGLCHQNLCVTKNDCKSYNLRCKCNLKCQNCGIVDTSKCICNCKEGWDMLDCSELCRDLSARCRKSNGYPNELSCSANDGKVQRLYCRKMCNQCQEVKKISNTCCNGMICARGYVLDTNCKCRLLCPGPKCDLEQRGVLSELKPSNENNHRFNNPLDKNNQRPEKPEDLDINPRQNEDENEYDEDFEEDSNEAPFTNKLNLFGLICFILHHWR